MNKILKFIQSLGQNKIDLAIHAALKTNETGMALSLIEAGADIETKDSEGFTPLQIAVGNNRIMETHALIKKGVDINAKGARGLTALHVAALSEAPGEVSRILLEAGADMYAKSDDGFSPISILFTQAYKRELQDNPDLTEDEFFVKSIKESGLDENAKNLMLKTLSDYEENQRAEKIAGHNFKLAAKGTGKPDKSEQGGGRTLNR